MNSIDAIATIFDEARARAPSVPTRSIEEVAADIDSLVAPRARPQEADDVYASATRGLRGASLSLENEQLFELSSSPNPELCAPGLQVLKERNVRKCGCFLPFAALAVSLFLAQCDLGKRTTSASVQLWSLPNRPSIAGLSLPCYRYCTHGMQSHFQE